MFSLQLHPSVSKKDADRKVMVEKELNDSNPPKPKRARQNTSNNEGASQSLLWTLFDEIVEENKSGEEAVSSKSVEAAVDDYLHDPVIPRERDPLIYWKEKCAVWPILVKIARKYLSIPPALFRLEGYLVQPVK